MAKLPEKGLGSISHVKSNLIRADGDVKNVNIELLARLYVDNFLHERLCMKKFRAIVSSMAITPVREMNMSDGITGNHTVQYHMYWMSEDGQGQIDGGKVYEDKREAEAAAFQEEMLKQCANDEDRRDILSGTIKFKEITND
jgi:hypothetical protein